MAIDRYSQFSHDQSDGDGGRGRSPLFASTQHFSRNLRKGRHDVAVNPALTVADAALARHLRLRAGGTVIVGVSPCVDGCVYVCGVIWLACGADVWPNVH